MMCPNLKFAIKTTLLEPNFRGINHLSLIQGSIRQIFFGGQRASLQLSHERGEMQQTVSHLKGLHWSTLRVRL